MAALLSPCVSLPSPSAEMNTRDEHPPLLLLGW